MPKIKSPEKLESPALDLNQNNESGPLEYHDSRKKLILEENRNIIGSDKVFSKIFESLDKKWLELNTKQKNRVLNMIEELVEKLKDYHHSYTNLKKSASLERRQVFGEDVFKFQESVKAADKREKILHDAFLDSLNILSRNMKKMGLDNSWRGMNEIWGGTHESNRQKAKLWMFKIFNEKI